MDIGVAIFPTHDGIAPGDVARLAEERGHESLFFPEHTHIPAGRESPYPGGGALPHKYAHTFDLFVAVTAALSGTRRLRVGSGICLVIERDPIITAKEVASVDFLSGGRFEFGVGAGWNREEMANHGTDPRVRMAVMRERVVSTGPYGPAARRRKDGPRDRTAPPAPSPGVPFSRFLGALVGPAAMSGQGRTRARRMCAGRNFASISGIACTCPAVRGVI